MVNTQARVVTISEQTARIDKNSEKQVNDAELDRIKKWLEVPDPSDNFHSALKKRHSETGLWFVEGSDFEKLKNSEPCLMWLHGNGEQTSLLLRINKLINMISGLWKNRTEVSESDRNPGQEL